MIGLVCATINQTVSHLKLDQIDIEYYYTANNDLDGDFIVSQLSVEMQNPNNPSIKLLVLASGGVQINTDQSGKYTCQADDSICETSLIHVRKNQLSQIGIKYLS